jgi:hypothetical protein
MLWLPIVATYGGDGVQTIGLTLSSHRNPIAERNDDDGGFTRSHRSIDCLARANRDGRHYGHGAGLEHMPLGCR